jgi:hypothetical protein
MKPVRLASIALQAERVRFKHMVQRLVVQAAMALIAVIFVAIAVVFGEFALYHFLLAYLPPAGSAGSIAGGDLVITLILFWLASRSSPGAAEREAAELSASARAGIRQSLDWTRYFNFTTLLWVFNLFRSRRRKV